MKENAEKKKIEQSKLDKSGISTHKAKARCSSPLVIPTFLWLDGKWRQDAQRPVSQGYTGQQRHDNIPSIRQKARTDPRNGSLTSAKCAGIYTCMHTHYKYGNLQPLAN